MSALRVHDVTLTGARVVLRPMTESDWPLIEAINNDPEVGYFSEDDEWAPYTLEKLQRTYRSISENALMFVVEHDGQPVGECWLQRMNEQRILDEFPGRDVRRIDLAIGAKHLWGKGLGSEAIRLLVRLAFEGEGVDLLVCFCGGHNPRSRRAFEKAGLAVLRTVPRPGSPKADFGYDLILTRELYGRSRDAHAAHAHGPPALGASAELGRAHPRLLGRWTDDPADPGRLPLDHSEVQRLCAAIAPGARLTDLGGVMSLNVRLDPPEPTDARSLVLRVHQPDVCVSRTRLLAMQEVRRRLAGDGLRVPVAVPWRGATVFRCGNRWAELEPFIANERLAPTVASNVWLYGAMGALHRAMAGLDLAVPRPVGAPYAPPSSVQRWLPITEAAVRGDPEATEIARLVRALAGRLGRAWVPATELPVQLVHGDARLSNVRRATGGQGCPAGETVYFDFGFAAVRPRVHDLGYSLAFMVWALDCLDTPEHFPWEVVPRLIGTYEAAAGIPLTAAERRALLSYTAAVPLFYAALDGFTEDPAGKLRTRVPFLRLSEWLLKHREAPWS